MSLTDANHDDQKDCENRRPNYPAEMVGHNLREMLDDGDDSDNSQGDLCLTGHQASAMTMPSLHPSSMMIRPAHSQMTSQRANPPYDMHKMLRDFWPGQKRKFENMSDNDVRRVSRHMELPMARVKKIMKIDDDVKLQMISQDAPLLLSAAAEMFVQELTLKAWQLVEEGRRKTLQKCDVAAAISRFEHFDFLIDIVPREEIKKYQVSGMPEDNNGSSEVANPSQPQQPQQGGGVQYVLADCEGGGNNVFQLDNGQVLHATAIGQPIPISDPSGNIDISQMQLPPGVQLIQMQTSMGQ